MFILNFTVEEINLVAIYKADTLAATLANITATLPDMDADMLEIAESVHRKLTTLTEPDFSALLFTPADEYEGGAYE